jgi:biopolymer transport protein TolQ
MNADPSFVDLILEASIVVKLVMLTLLMTSVYSWTVIFNRWKVISYAKSSADKFEKRFWSGMDLSVMFKQLSTGKKELRGLENIFQAGFNEYARLNEQSDIDPMSIVEGSHRMMKVSMNREVEYLENHLTFLATIASASPYVGLFGTVWGIMNSFMSLGASQQQATLSVVAPGIAEALIATAMGLFVAIPAVIFYNRYASQVNKLYTQYEGFVDEFAALIQRQVHVVER